MIELFDRLELIIENQHGVVTYASPIGMFPRSYDVVMPNQLGLLTDLDEHERSAFARGHPRKVGLDVRDAIAVPAGATTLPSSDFRSPRTNRPTSWSALFSTWRSTRRYGVSMKPYSLMRP